MVNNYFKHTFLILTIVALFGCKKSDNSNSNNSSTTAIVGKWLSGQETLVNYSATGTETGRTTNAAAAINTANSFYYVFNSDGTESLYEYSTTGKAYVFRNSGTYTFKTSTMIEVSVSGLVTDYTISFTDNNTMVLSNNYAYQNGTQSNNYTYSRQ